ncbi:hypothetical protein [Pseudodesulfovibrio piezophilus]|uniref:Lipoprotein n=1 Tax=Pseudodesulfovibrio piezophilus (strain DSM 21447 / JCM 15486 / C1TLV30) TaxID=1322246 RepID=M1WRM8_PSEP2|nr:hypothetical protein [Pseudodesulfovibrio piezophilus]CCH49659.1 conserved exported protein of unknown function [Pseudodesulfovibrio piezophilus C1TLV30]
MKLMKTALSLGILLLMLSLGYGCNRDNAIKLTYALGPQQVSCPGSVVIFKFEDKRSDVRLGRNNDGTAIASLSDVSDWVGWALFDELKAAGCDVKYRTTTVAPGETPLVSGEVLDVSLNQTGTTTFVGKITVKVMVHKGGKTVHVEKFTSEVQDVVVPGYGTQGDIMAEALRGLMSEIVPAVCKSI